VTLEVQQGLARDRADLLDLVITDPDAAPLELLEVVEGAPRIDLAPLVPQRSVRCEVLVHTIKDGRRPGARSRRGSTNGAELTQLRPVGGPSDRKRVVAPSDGSPPTDRVDEPRSLPFRRVAADPAD